MKQNTAAQSTTRRAPVGVCSNVTSSRWAPPPRPRTSVSVRTSMRGIGGDPVDQVAGHAVGQVGRRMTIDTRQPDWLRKMAAWPAELPPPTTTTSQPAHDLRLEIGGGIEDAVALEHLEVRDVESPVPGPGGDDDRPAGDLALVGQGDARGTRPRRGARRPRTGWPATPPGVAPGWPCGRPGHHRRSRWGSRRSSRSASSNRPAPRARRRRGTPCRGPRKRRRPTAARPAGPTPTTTRSKVRPGIGW